MLMTGCSEQSEEVPSQKEVLAESVKKFTDEYRAKTGPFSKYQTVKEYITDIADRWVNEAKTSEMKAEILNDALVYADYFQDEIEEMGLKEDFDKLQLLGLEILNKNHVNEGNEERWDNFHKQLGEILSQIDGTMVSKKHSPEDAERLAQLKGKTVTHTEYFSLMDYLYSLGSDWERGSEVRKLYHGDDAEPHLASVAIAYTNYFEKEITELGLKEEFDTFQLSADNVVQNYGKDGYVKHKEEFEYKLYDMKSTVVEASRFEDMQSWASASVGILSEPLARYDENAKQIALRAYKVMYSFPLNVIEEKSLDSEEGEIQSKTILLASEILIQQRVAERPKDFEELWAKYDEMKQYIEDVANEYQ